MKAVTETPIVSTKPHVNMPASELDRIFEEGLSNHEELSVVRTLVDNIKNRSVLLYGQGIYDRTTKKIGHIEVLARLSDGERVFSPFLFLSFVKKFGLSTDFDMLVVEKTLQHIQRAGNDDVAYSINLHKSTLNDESCHRTIQELMDLYKIRTGGVIFEILEEESTISCTNTRDGIMSDKNDASRPVGLMCDTHGDTCSCADTQYQVLADSIARYKEENSIVFSVDDFPMGTNCIHNVRRMKGVDYVKIDGVWLLSMLENFKKIFPNGEEMLLRTFQDILTEIRRTHPKVVFVVERMENAYLFNLFKRIDDVRFFQGYHFSRTKNLMDIEEEVREHNRNAG